ncbi:hypothetical protein [Mycobacteroides abscessus]|uniref:hypothetical protein n=1 Tax=Mycobacteroides abscessus TaxID=36809 RepID=UPI0009A7EB9F|nr:hypothetical protein [Mycobacteroides abscessus]MBE5513724.1 hypothetical protein [Mycobacteroides abscessus]SLC90907.1 Uncharacterised protein [Mycobacteroides abscessus subsp. massiliense]SLE31768.1 Uncharacterised protein [Mycobacteroides abscessus subsp. massiliense]SLE58909.1 Uncharacterised protein [Mycobacteroides abscessus subsp. massiliense]
MAKREWEVFAHEARWLSLTEISGTGWGDLRVPCADTDDIAAVEAALREANLDFRWDPGRRLIASVG